MFYVKFVDLWFVAYTKYERNSYTEITVENDGIKYKDTHRYTSTNPYRTKEQILKEDMFNEYFSITKEEFDTIDKEPKKA